MRSPARDLVRADRRRVGEDHIPPAPTTSRGDDTSVGDDVGHGCAGEGAVADGDRGVVVRRGGYRTKNPHKYDSGSDLGGSRLLLVRRQMRNRG